MTHFLVLVCLHADTELPELTSQLSEILEQWNENREVPQYREYISGDPESFWWVQHIRATAEHLDNDHRNVLASTPVEPTPALEEAARNAACAAQLGTQPGWQQVVTAYNERFSPYDGATEGDLADAGPLFYDREKDSAYEITTRNPEGRWDWWVIGGRWSGHFIAARSAAADLIWGRTDRNWESNAISDGRLHCDGGPVGALDLTAMRDRAAAAARHRYQQWTDLQAASPPAKGWSHFARLVESGTLTSHEARSEYRSQPVIAKAHEGLSGRFDPCPFEEFLADEADYVAEAASAAISGYALVTLERDWLAPGEMGWFGYSSDSQEERSEYYAQVNHYLDRLDPATLIVAIDCHV